MTDKEMTAMILAGMSAEKSEVTEKFLNFFAPKGRRDLLAFLVKAKEAGKLDAGILVLAKQIPGHWGYQAPERRGVMTLADHNYLVAAYKALGMEPPIWK